MQKIQMYTQCAGRLGHNLNVIFMAISLQIAQRHIYIYISSRKYFEPILEASEIKKGSISLL